MDDETRASGGVNDRGRRPAIPDFEILEEIGRGGMGVVYRARQISLDRVVAIKTIVPELLDGPRAIERFKHEAEAAGRLSHPHVVPVHGAGVSGDTHYFVMGFVAGESLAHLIGRRALGEEEALRLIAGVAAAIRHAHEHGVIHRDLKPANILVDGDGFPRVTDFGLAKSIDDRAGPTLSGDTIGTPGYMPPEQVLGRLDLIGPAADVWGLGATLYALLAGRPPFRGGSVAETLRMIVEDEPPRLRRLAPGVSREVELIAHKCLQKPPELRYASVAEFEADLAALREGRSISAASARFGDLFARWIGSNPQMHLLQHWRTLWLLHAGLIALCALLAQVMLRAGVEARGLYVLVMSVTFVLWAPIFMHLRRRLGPVVLVERHLAHLWGANILGMAAVFAAEWLLDLPVLTLAFLMAVSGAATCLVKASIVSGLYYLHVAAHLVAAGLMVVFPEVRMILLGLAGAGAFVFSGIRGAPGEGPPTTNEDFDQAFSTRASSSETTVPAPPPTPEGRDL